MENANDLNLKHVSGHIVDLINNRIFDGTITIQGNRILSVAKNAEVPDQYVLPGLIDAHVHIESSMLVPSEFARMAVIHGTVATVSDPHEIANVLGIQGVEFMIRNGQQVPFRFFFGAPSCVPATTFESSGATIGVSEIEQLLSRKDVYYLSEMMNFPGVLAEDPEIMAKLVIARKLGKPIDGHAPGLRGEAAEKYIRAGISTDHECFTIDEAREKIRYGMKILIREGSAAKNYNELAGLIAEYPEMVMFCSDDKHPDDLIKGHINEMVKEAIRSGNDPLRVLRCAVLNPVNHYHLDVGLLREGDYADFIVVDNLQSFNVLETWIGGQMVSKHGESFIAAVDTDAPNIFKAAPISPGDLKVPSNGQNIGKIRVIRAIDGQLITETLLAEPLIVEDCLQTDPSRDILKIVVYNRYRPAKPAVAFIHGFGIRSGAMASTIAHDSHNIVAVGVEDDNLARAINLVVENQGGIAFVDGRNQMVLPLPVAGLMSAADGRTTASLYEKINLLVKSAGSAMHSPFMTLSFMALLVIPELKLSDKGLFDGKTFQFTSLFV